MDNNYRPHTVEGCLKHVAEECAELAKAALKAERFGLAPTQDVHGVTYDNRADVKQEIADVRMAIMRLEDAMGEDG